MSSAVNDLLYFLEDKHDLSNFKTDAFFLIIHLEK